MPSPEWSSILDLYQRIVSAGLIQYLQMQVGMKSKRGIYGAPTVVEEAAATTELARNPGQRSAVANPRSG